MKKSYFWGLLFILIGISLILKHVFHIFIPVFSIIVAFVFIYIGFSIISRGRSRSGGGDSNSYAGGSLKNDYHVTFGSMDVDLRTLPMPLNKSYINVDVAFGRCTLRINESIPLVVKVDAAFSGVNTPDNTVITFGNYTYRTASFNEANPYYEVRLSVNFGSSEIYNS